MVKWTQSKCPSKLAMGKDLNLMSLEALEIIDKNVPDTNMLTPFDSGSVKEPLDVCNVDLDSVLKPPEWMRQMTVDLAGTGKGVNSYMLQLVKSITHPAVSQLTGKAIAEMAVKFTSSLAINLAQDLVLANPATMVLLGIKKAFNYAKMSYKLVNKGIKLKRSLDRALMLRRVKNRLKAKCKARANKSIKELASLQSSCVKLEKMIEKDKKDVKEFVEVTLRAQGKLPKKEGGLLSRKSKEPEKTKTVVLALPEVLVKGSAARGRDAPKHNPALRTLAAAGDVVRVSTRPSAAQTK
jgi:hypothetical protein